MKGVIAVTALLVVCAGAASGIIEGGSTFPNAWVYDGLITYDHMGLPTVPNALHVNTGISYLMASKIYDKDGKAQDTDLDWTMIAVPVDIGYSFNERVLVDVTLQFVNNKIKDNDPDDGGEYSAAGLGDVWVKGCYVAPVDSFNLGGRLGIKIPVGKVDYDSEKPELGDGQVDIDVAAVGSKYPDEGFAFNGQIGFRYRLTETATFDEEEQEPQEIKYTPGILFYTHLEPGYSMGPEKFQVYLPIGYMMTTKTKAESEGTKITVDDSATNGLYVGLAPKYGIDANNTIGLKFLYPVMGTGGESLFGPFLFKSMLIGLTYEGYIPL